MVVQPLSPPPPLPFIRNFVASTYFNLFGGRGDGKTIRRQFRGDRIRLEIVDRTFPRSSSVKGPAGIFCKRDYIAHVQTGSNNSL